MTRPSDAPTAPRGAPARPAPTPCRRRFPAPHGAPPRMSELVFGVEPADNDRLANLCGQFDEHLKQIERRLGVDIGHRGDRFRLVGDPARIDSARHLIDYLYSMTEKEQLSPESVHLALQDSGLAAIAERGRAGAAAPETAASAGAGAGVQVPSAPLAAAENAARAVSGADGAAAVGPDAGTAEASGAGADGEPAPATPAPTPAQNLVIKTRRVMIQCRGPRQTEYVQSVKDRDLTFGIGPAGTGKTFLAVAAAVEALETDRVQRLVLVRPAVEAGERLGFLPGDMMQKVDPYLRPIYDALYEFLGIERVGKLVERNVIEIAPLAYMRGRTLNHSFVIMDEAQNTTVEQMKMFLTRIGFGSSAVVTGDTSQVDLPKHQMSGLKHVQGVLRGVEGIGFCEFTASDVVRHPLVQRIVAAYDRIEAEAEAEGDS